MGYSRRNAFVPVPTITSFEDFNQWLWEWCEQDAQRLHYKYKLPIQELWEADEKSLLKLPEHPFPIFRYEAVTVNKYGFATLDTNKYGLAPALSGRIVQAKLFFNHVEFYYDHKPVGRYKRSYERENRNCVIGHSMWGHFLRSLVRWSILGFSGRCRGFGRTFCGSLKDGSGRMRCGCWMRS